MVEGCPVGELTGRSGGTISDTDAGYALRVIRAICAEVGPGLPGSPQERERAAIIRGELESHLGAENVTAEDFTLSPWAFVGSLSLGALFTLLAAMLNIGAGRPTGFPLWLSAAAALALSTASLLLVFLEYGCYVEFVDPLFRRGTSVNVVGTLRRPGDQEVRRVLILSGHHDSAPENTWIRFLGYGFLVTVPTIFLGFTAMVVMSIIQATGVLIGDAGVVRAGTLGSILLAYPIVPSIVFALFFVRGRRGGGTVPGAVDNLSASAVVVAMCRFLVQNPSCIPAGTEVRFVSFGSEEAGLRGSRRYAERHLDELRRLEARVRVKPYPVGGGASDVGPFTQAGLKALTLLPFKMPQQIVAFFHQEWDGPEAVTMEPLLNVLKLSYECVRTGGE